MTAVDSETKAIDFSVIQSDAEDLLSANANNECFADDELEDFMLRAPLTDVGIAECFAVESGGSYRYNKTLTELAADTNTFKQPNKAKMPVG
jgi:hypothetical protein